MGRKPKSLSLDLSRWSPELAWMAGVVYGDGYSSNRKGKQRVTVVSGDEELLGKWVSVVGRGVVRKRKDCNTWQVEVGSMFLSQWFADRGIDGKKAGSLMWPRDLPEEFKVHFVRGLWDTDGSVMRQKREGKRIDQLRLCYCSKARDFVERVAEEAPVKLFVEKQVVQRLGRYKGYEYWIATVGGRQAELFFDWLYLDSPEALRLNRKWDVGVKFKEWIESITSRCERCGKEVRDRRLCRDCQRVKWENAVCGCGGSPVVAKGLCRRCYNKERRARLLDWKDDIALCRLEAFSKDKWLSLDATEMGSEVDWVVRTYLDKGCPMMLVKRLDEDDPLGGVRRGVVEVDGNVVVNKGRKGQRICSAAHPHRLEARHRTNKCSVVKAFKSEELIRKAVLFQLEHGERVTPMRVVNALSAMLKSPLNFPPVLARWIVDNYADTDGIVFDPCAGYGGRLLGAMASERNVTYVGHDIEPRTVNGNKRLAKWLDVEDRVCIEKAGVEDMVKWPEASLIFTSPPYYNREVYGDYAEKRLRRYGGVDEWIDGFLATLVGRSLGYADKFVLNIAAIRLGDRIIDLPGEVCRLVENCGGVVEYIWDWKTSVFGSRSSTEKLIVCSGEL